MSLDPVKDATPALRREDSRTHPLKTRVCVEHALAHGGQCPVCEVVMEQQRKLARLQEINDMLHGTIDQLYARIDDLLQ